MTYVEMYRETFDDGSVVAVEFDRSAARFVQYRAMRNKSRVAIDGPVRARVLVAAPPKPVNDDTLTVNMSDTRRAIAQHTSGGTYVVEEASLWRGDDCVGARIVAGRVLTPSNLHDLGINPSEMPTAVTFDTIDRLSGLDARCAKWLDAQGVAGNLSYPFGAR